MIEKYDQWKEYVSADECTRRRISKHNVTLATTTDLWYLRQEIIGEPSLKRGVTGEISKYAMKDLAGAFEIFAKIKQTNRDVDETSIKIWLVF